MDTKLLFYFAGLFGLIFFLAERLKPADRLGKDFGECAGLLYSWHIWCRLNLCSVGLTTVATLLSTWFQLTVLLLLGVLTLTVVWLSLAVLFPLAIWLSLATRLLFLVCLLLVSVVLFASCLAALRSAARLTVAFVAWLLLAIGLGVVSFVV